MHYHIRWSGSKLDWERFSTHQEAEQVARQLTRPGETFTIEHVDDKTCRQCLKIYKTGLANSGR
jgi:regulation of enolase protein 1 (concanavalin A-like superfamily)